MENNLKDSKSPYLRQHRDNPVAWQPWGEEAFQEARKEDKPIFLSIGYSTCHWCHVMARESFEDEEVAARLNEVFVPVKVDREERPDIDSIYMKAAILATGRGGWPLSIFMTPEGEPFFTATYIPRNARFGSMGFIQLIDRIEHLWKHDRDDLINSSREITKALKREMNKEGSRLDDDIHEKAIRNFSNGFDRQNGGFGSAPKFPSPHQLIYLLGRYRISGDEGILDMVKITLDSIARGGINDHVGGGFHRYSTDGEWLVPHFEKMLYDQALLILAFTEAYLATGMSEYESTVRRVVDYIARDLGTDEGLFSSAEDADSEGEEGKFYTWRKDEIIRILGKERGKEFASHFGIRDEGNFRDESTGSRNGMNIIHLVGGNDPEGFEEDLEILRTEREMRTRPSRDGKVLTDWNALMISALSKAGQAFDDTGLIEMAERTIASLERHLKKGGIWHHRYIDGDSAVPAMLDDISFLAIAYLDLYESTFEIEYLEKAISMVDILIGDFYSEEGGFYNTSSNSEVLIARQKEAYDGAMPSGNSVALSAFERVARMTGRTDLEDIAWRSFSYFSPEIERAPTGFSAMLSAFMHSKGPSREIVISGNMEDDATKEMIGIVWRSFYPNKVVLLKEEGENGKKLEMIAPFTKENEPLDGRTTAYVCQGWNCDIPTTDPDQLRSSLL